MPGAETFTFLTSGRLGQASADVHARLREPARLVGRSGVPGRGAEPVVVRDA